MARASPHALTAKPRTILTLPNVRELRGPVLTEQNLADPDEGIDAAMDYWIPPDASRETLRQAQRRLFVHIAWLLDEALPGHPSWARDEMRRAVRRLVELQAASKNSRPKLH